MAPALLFENQFCMVTRSIFYQQHLIHQLSHYPVSAELATMIHCFWNLTGGLLQHVLSGPALEDSLETTFHQDCSHSNAVWG